MTTLDLKKLTSCGSDWEANQYTLLSRVKEWTDQIRGNKLFPALYESIQLNFNLEEILRENLESKWWFDSEIKARRLNERITVYEKAHQIGFQLEKLLEFVEWALYLNRPVLEEGEIIRNFIEDNISIKKVTSNKNYLGKGYFTLPDNKKELLNIYYYEVNWDWYKNEVIHTMDTKLIRTVPFESIKISVEEFVKDFISNYQQLYDPVAFIFQTDLDFSYEETMLPIAEEKLLDEIKVY
ncbi:MAG: hypothetical protein HKM87_06005 [Ignavibacteriaceae bacterium]|nr:hypothetical protein [Ignavibacteriaceae bacterium]